MEVKTVNIDRIKVVTCVIIASSKQQLVQHNYAKVAELVDALVLGTSGETRESSSLSFRMRQN